MADMVVKSPKTPTGRELQVYPSHGGVVQEQGAAQRGCHHSQDGERTQNLAETQFLSPGTSRYRKSLRQPLHIIWSFLLFPLAALRKIHCPFGLLQPLAERSCPFITGRAAERTSQFVPPSLLG